MFKTIALLRSVALFFGLTIIVSAQFRFDSWTTDKGLPQNSVRAIVRTRDGYLWLGTFEGLVRFDGVNFTVFDNVNTPEFKGNFVDALIEDREGNLWIGIDGGGLVKRTGNQFIHYSTDDGLSSNNIRCLLKDREGNVWAGADDGGLNVFRDGKLTKMTTEDGLPDNHIWSLAEDNEGSIWIATSNGLAFLKDGKLSIYTQRDGLSSNIVNVLWWNDTDGLWIGTAKGVNRFQNGKISTVGGQNERSNQIIQALAEDHENNLWIGTQNNGLFRYNPYETASPIFVDSLPDKDIPAIYTDTENNLWVGSYFSGLYRFRNKRLRPLTVAGVAQEGNTRTVYEDKAGNLWFSSDGKLNRFKDGHLTVFDSEPGLPSGISVIFEDNEGSLWFGGNGISRYKDGRFIHLSTADGLISNHIFTMTTDRENNLWVGTENGLSVLQPNGQFNNHTTNDGLVNNFIISSFTDRSGAVWIGTRNGLSRFKDGSFTNWTTGDGLAGNHILSFYEAGDGALWIGTSGSGLSRYKDGKFTTVTSRNGLFDNLAFQILDDGHGNLWMCGNKGIYRASLEELNDFADGRRESVNSYSYDSSDGMINRECNGSSPAGWKTRDGTIWFPTVKGLIAIDGQEEENQPPIVIIEQLRLDGKVLKKVEPPEINPGQANLEISYTGISWQRPQQIKFKYKLEGLDADWVDAGTRRTAFYPHLPPGEYTFKVIADNGEGVWNLAGQSLKVTVFPPFYRTWWFIGLSVLLVGSGAVLIYRRRIKQLEKAKFAQEEFSRRLINAHESERRRIAAELHDGLGQSLAMIKNTAVFGQSLSKDLETAKSQLDKISLQSARAVAEVREIAYNLRPYLLDRLGLTKAIKSLLNKLADTGACDLSSDVDEIDGLFSKDEEISIYRIIQECLNNVLKHADANEVIVEVKRQESLITINIRDDGRGFDANPADEEDKKGGFGLLGIAERVRMLSGNYSIQSKTAKGTTIFISVDLNNRRRENINAGSNQNYTG